MKNLLFILLLAVAFCSCDKGRVPKYIDVTKISLTAFPSFNMWGGVWDNDGTGPDIAFLFTNTQGLVEIGDTKNNVTSSLPPSWSINKTMNPPETYKLTFYEVDSPYDSEMISFYFNYKSGDDYPNPIRVSANGYTVELEVVYKFE